MAEYKVKLIMSEEYIVNAESAEEAEKIARDKFGNDYLIDDVEIRLRSQNSTHMEYWEVDLRSRKDGNSIETIFSGESHDKACECLQKWYDEHPELDAEAERESYVDGAEGVFADIYLTTDPHGVGNW